MYDWRRSGSEWETKHFSTSVDLGMDVAAEDYLQYVTARALVRFGD